MNKIFKVIWNPATGSYSVASETAKSRGKKSGRSKLLISALVAGGLLSSSGALAQAGLDTGTGVTPAGHNNGTGWIAIGTDAEASTHTTTNGAATAVGYYSKALGMWSTALGAYSESNGNASLALGVKAQSNGDRSISMGASSSASINAGYSIAMGVFAFTDAEYAVALGNESKALGKYSLALGNASQASGESSIALGNTSEASEQNAIALGQGSIASKVNSIALGSNSSSAGENAIALGEGSAAGGSNSLAFGSQSRASGNDSVALGVGATAATDNSVAIGAGSTTDASNTVSVGNSTTKRKIVNMAAGAISNTSTDAINGSQLYTISDSVAKRLGGGATVGNDGSISAVSYALKSGTYNNVGDALSGIDNNTLQWNRTAGAFTAAHGSNTTSKITNVAKGTVSATSTDVVNGSQLYDLQQDALLWNGTAFSAAHGTNATNKITNVTAGELSDTSTDAVNGSQLKTTNDNVATNTTNIATNTTNITNLTDAVDSLGDDSLLWNKAAGAFSAAHGTDATSKITNVTAGELSDTSTDAVNGSQLKTTNDNVATNTTNIATNTTNITNLTDTVNNLGEDALKWDDAAGAFTAAHGTNATNKISNVQAGIVSSDSTDAINGSQLYGLADSFTSYLGGGADISDTGVLTGPTYSIGGTDYTNVGDALAAINTSFSDSLGDALLWDATANDGAGAFSAGRGVDNTASKITNVANGAISATSSDAINGSQLYTTNKYIADALGGDAEVNADGTITAPTYTIANTDYNNVGEALDALDENALLWDATANNGEGAYNASHDGKASIITNVADGNIGEGSTDAINGSQLFNTNMLIQQNSEVINQLAGNTSETYIEENGAGINYVRTNDTGLTFTDASAAGIGSTAVGYNTVAKGDSSVAIGQGSYSGVETSIALGSESVSSRVIVKGSRNTSVSEEGVVIGYDTTDGELLGALSIGDDGKYRQIINVADGSEAHDAVTVRQLQNAIGAVATTPTKYYHANSTAEDSLAVGEDSLAMGAKTIVNGNAGIGIGLNTLVLADAINGIAIGSNASANHANSIAMGNGSQTTRGAQTNYTAYNMDAPQNSVGEFSVGSEDGQRQITNVAAGSADTDAVNVGQLKVTDAQVSQNTQSITNLNNQVTNLDTRVTNIENGIGDIVTTGSTKYFKTNTDGVDANAQGKDSVAIGSGSIAAADNSVALGTGSVANEENTISVGSSTNQRRITNVAAGVNATDAVNVSQLKSSEAGGVRYDTKADGSVDYSNITLGGGNGGTTRISNVSAGVNNNDAVNYAQLKQSVQETKQYTDQRMVEMDNKLSKTESKLSGGIASAMAMTGLPQAYTPGASMASIGGGTYNGESAVALGVSMVSANGRWVYKLQGSTNSQGEYSAALGAGIQW
ncbi:YadA-like family protein [Escherichia coli]|nr:YadA-like family protein [Escherichia coli]